MKIFSAAMPGALHDQLVQHLTRPDGQEDLCFALWNCSTGEKRYSALIKEIIFPIEGDRILHGNVSFTAAYFDKVISEARRKKMGVAFFHNHFTPGWEDMSETDVKTEKYMAPIVQSATGLPLVGLTMGSDGAWSARFWNKKSENVFQRKWCHTVRVAGRKFTTTYNNSLIGIPKFSEGLARTVSAWGKRTQSDISRLKVGVIGTGSVGSIVAESLRKIGVRDLLLMDFDALEEKNFDRTLLYDDPKNIGRSKALALAKILQKKSLIAGTNIEGCEYSIIEEKGFRKALDCDLLFCCVDRPWPRYVLDKIAYAHLIPVIDGGILVETDQVNEKILAADWKTNLAAPGKPCLECIGQYAPEDVSLEQSGMLENSGYIAGLDKRHFIHRNENVFAFSLNLAALELQQFLSYVIAPFGISSIGGKVYHFITGELDKEKVTQCKQNCLKKNYLAEGDKVSAGLYGRHPMAEEAREKRQPKSWRKKINSIFRPK